MKAPPFKYVRPTSLDEALELLSLHGDEARVLAGGQSLLPVLHLRLAAPAILIDINGIDALRGIALADGRLRIGALARHADVARSPEVARAAPMLSLAMPYVAHAAVRNRGSFGGSLALADPAAEIPAVCVALDARFELRSVRGSRVVPAREFFLGVYTTELAPDEILVAADIPAAGTDELVAFDELARRHGDYAVVGTCAQMRRDGEGRSRDVRIALFGVASTPMLAMRTAGSLEGGRLDAPAIDAARAVLREEIDPMGDVHTLAQTKRYLACVQLGRVLQRLAA